MSKKAVILLSGGIDSTTTLAVLKRSQFDIYAISFLYDQTLSIEVERAKNIAKHYGVKEHKIIHISLGKIGGSLLLGDENVKDIESSIPPTYVPARNTIFLSFAIAYAEVIGATSIFYGANFIDYSGYPDCRPEFIKAFEQMANLATRASVEDKNKFRIIAPLLYLKKSEIISLGISLGVDYAMTTSCYFPTNKGLACGICPSCKIRLKAFKDLGISDPLPYR